MIKKILVLLLALGTSLNGQIKAKSCSTGSGGSLYYGYGCNGTATNTCTTTGTANSNDLSAAAQGSYFTVGSNAAGYTLQGIGVYLNAKPSAPNDVLQFAIYALNGSRLPTTLICNTGDVTMGSVPGWTEGSPSSCSTLTANTEYLILFQYKGNGAQPVRQSTGTNVSNYGVHTYGTWASGTGTLTNIEANYWNMYMKVSAN